MNSTQRLWTKNQVRKSTPGHELEGKEEPETKLRAIGKKEPVMAIAFIDGKERDLTEYDLSPRDIIKQLGLQKPIFAKTAQWGHFGRGFAWS